MYSDLFMKALKLRSWRYILSTYSLPLICVTASSLMWDSATSLQKLKIWLAAKVIIFNCFCVSDAKYEKNKIAMTRKLTCSYFGFSSTRLEFIVSCPVHVYVAVVVSSGTAFVGFSSGGDLCWCWKYCQHSYRRPPELWGSKSPATWH